MKKAIALIFVIVMALSLVACGAPTQEDAIEVFNTTSVVLGEACAIVEEDPEAYPGAYDELFVLSEAMGVHYENLTTKELTEDEIAAAIAELEAIEARVGVVREEYGF